MEPASSTLQSKYPGLKAAVDRILILPASGPFLYRQMLLRPVGYIPGPLKNPELKFTNGFTQVQALKTLSLLEKISAVYSIHGLLEGKKILAKGNEAHLPMPCAAQSTDLIAYRKRILHLVGNAICFPGQIPIRHFRTLIFSYLGSFLNASRQFSDFKIEDEEGKKYPYSLVDQVNYMVSDFARIFQDVDECMLKDDASKLTVYVELVKEFTSFFKLFHKSCSSTSQKALLRQQSGQLIEILEILALAFEHPVELFPALLTPIHASSEANEFLRTWEDFQAISTFLEHTQRCLDFLTGYFITWMRDHLRKNQKQYRALGVPYEQTIEQGFIQLALAKTKIHDLIALMTSTIKEFTNLKNCAHFNLESIRRLESMARRLDDSNVMLKEAIELINRASSQCRTETITRMCNISQQRAMATKDRNIAAIAIELNEAYIAYRALIEVPYLYILDFCENATVTIGRINNNVVETLQTLRQRVAGPWSELHSSWAPIGDILQHRITGLCLKILQDPELDAEKDPLYSNVSLLFLDLSSCLHCIKETAFRQQIAASAISREAIAERFKNNMDACKQNIKDAREHTPNSQQLQQIDELEKIADFIANVQKFDLSALLLVKNPYASSVESPILERTFHLEFYRAAEQMLAVIQNYLGRALQEYNAVKRDGLTSEERELDGKIKEFHHFCISALKAFRSKTGSSSSVTHDSFENEASKYSAALLSLSASFDDRYDALMDSVHGSSLAVHGKELVDRLAAFAQRMNVQLHAHRQSLQRYLDVKSLHEESPTKKNRRREKAGPAPDQGELQLHEDPTELSLDTIKAPNGAPIKIEEVRRPMPSSLQEIADAVYQSSLRLSRKIEHFEVQGANPGYVLMNQMQKEAIGNLVQAAKELRAHVRLLDKSPLGLAAVAAGQLAIGIMAEQGSKLAVVLLDIKDSATGDHILLSKQKNKPLRECHDPKVFVEILRSHASSFGKSFALEEGQERFLERADGLVSVKSRYHETGGDHFFLDLAQEYEAETPDEDYLRDLCLRHCQALQEGLKAIYQMLSLAEEDSPLIKGESLEETLRIEPGRIAQLLSKPDSGHASEAALAPGFRDDCERSAAALQKSVKRVMHIREDYAKCYLPLISPYDSSERARITIIGNSLRDLIPAIAVCRDILKAPLDLSEVTAHIKIACLHEAVLIELTQKILLAHFPVIAEHAKGTHYLQSDHFGNPVKHSHAISKFASMTLETLKSAYPELITPELEELASSTFKRSVELEPILKTQYRYISPADRLAQWREISQLYDAAVQNTLTYAQEEQIRRLLSLESSAPILPGLKSLIRDKMMREVHWPLYQTLRLTQQWLALYTEHLLPSNLP